MTSYVASQVKEADLSVLSYDRELSETVMTCPSLIAIQADKVKHKVQKCPWIKETLGLAILIFHR